MKSIFAAVVVCAMVSACGGGGDDKNGTIVVAESRTLIEGEQVSYTLTAGAYAVEITSSNNGVIVSWLGGSGAGCVSSAEVKSYTTACTLSIQGQLLVSNPTTFGIGGSEVVSFKVTKN